MVTYFLLIGAIILSYFFYTRIYTVYSRLAFYKRQGIPFHSWVLPCIGSYLQLINHLEADKDHQHPMIAWNRETYFPKSDDEVPPISGVVYGSEVSLMINRPEVVEELLIIKNKFYDKHPSSARLIRKVTGDSIVFAQSDLMW